MGKKSISKKKFMNTMVNWSEDGKKGIKGEGTIELTKMFKKVFGKAIAR